MIAKTGSESAAGPHTGGKKVNPSMTNVNANTLSAPTAGLALAKVVILRHEIPLLLFETQNPPHSIHLKIKSNRFRGEIYFYMNECKKVGKNYRCKNSG